VGVARHHRRAPAPDRRLRPLVRPAAPIGTRPERWHGIVHIAGALDEVKRDVIEKSTKTNAGRRITLDVGSVRVLTDSRNAARHLLAFGRLDLLPDAFVLSHRPDVVVLRGGGRARCCWARALGGGAGPGSRRMNVNGRATRLPREPPS
jgi:hypothetical protein